MSQESKVRAGEGRGARGVYTMLAAALTDRGLPPDGAALDKSLREIARLANNRLVRFGLSAHPDGSGEDIAIEVVFDLYKAAEDGRLVCGDADELAALVWGMVRSEVLRFRQRASTQSRGGPGRSGRQTPPPGTTPGETTPDELRPSRRLVEPVQLDEVADSLTDRGPSPEQIACAREIEARFAALFDDDAWREIALGRLEGLTLEEIARRSGSSVSTVRRRLQAAQEVFKDLRNRVGPDG